MVTRTTTFTTTFTRLTIALLVVAATTTVAIASPPQPDEDYGEDTTGDDDDSPAFNMLGFRMSAGALPVDGGETRTLSVGLGVEHPVFKKTRVFGEAEWLWLTPRDERGMDSVVVRPARYGNGHRVSAGLRREVIAKNTGRSVRMFIDGELGGALALTNDSVGGFAMMPAAIVGLRFGYDLYSRSDSSPSRTFEVEVLVRAIAVQDGIGALMGVGMAWGN
jgi:hypothetical protein